MKNLLSKYLVQILAIALGVVTGLLIVLWFVYDDVSTELKHANAKLAVVDNNSAVQEEKIKVVTKEVEVIKWKTKEKLRYVMEYSYDENKSECCNGIDSMRNTF